MKKNILYHSTTASFCLPFHEQHTFFALNYDFANEVVSFHNYEALVTLKCELTFGKSLLFDPRNDSHLEQLEVILPDFLELPVYDLPAEKLTRRFFIHQLKLFTAHCWRFIEDDTITDKIKSLGFRGHIAREENEITYCIYSPNESIKIISLVKEELYKWEELK